MNIIVLDFETGGIQPHHPNIQLAAIAVDGAWDEVSLFERKIAFDPALCEPEALELNHYSPKAWNGAATGSQVFAGFCKWLDRYKSVKIVSKRTGRPYEVARLAAYNAGFDKDRLWAMSGGQPPGALRYAACGMGNRGWQDRSGEPEAFRRRRRPGDRNGRRP